MSGATNSAARNTMTPWERQCYDWGWEDSGKRIIDFLQLEASELLGHDGECDCRYKGDEILMLIKRIEESK